MLQFLKDFSTNYVLMSAVFSWLLAQFFKIFTGRFVDNKKNIFQLLTATGGMPSSHAATVVALLTSVIIKDGISSTYAAICGILTIIVLVDATGVRRETGLQGAILNRMIAKDESGTYDDFTKGLKELVGHTPLQVFFGAILGFLVGFFCQYIPFLIVHPEVV